MADTNQNRRAEFFDDDPFAELTRIMGHDPRGQEPAQPAAAADDFDVDLEKELMGELDFSEFDQPEAVFDAPPPEADLPSAATPFEAVQDTGHAEPETGFAPAEAEPAFVEEDFGSALERELFADQDEQPFVEDAAFAPEPVAEWSEPVAGEPVAPEAFEDAASHTVAAHELVAEEPVAEEQEPAAEEPVAPESFEAAVAGTVAEFADADLDLSFLEEDIANDAEAARVAGAEPAPTWDSELIEETHELASYEPSQEPAYEPVREPFFSPPEPAAASLEDELSALLGEDTPATATAAAQDDWHPGVETFGRANFAATAPQPAPEWEYTASAEAADHASAGQEVASHAGPETDDFAEIFGDDFALDVEEQPAAQAEPAQPEATEARPIAAAAASGLAALSQWLPRSGKSAAPVEAPEVETVDVAEAAPAMVDDLDIPDVDYASPEPRAYDDLGDIEAEFAEAFGDFPNAGQPQPEYAPAAASTAVSRDEFPADAYALDENAWQATAQPADDDGFDYENDLEHAIAMSAYDDEVAERPAPRKRGLMIAALVAGVAVIGGAGVYGMSFLGGGSDGPALVRAGDDPMKVRPENPGGATVPNQDSQAYERVANGQQETAPGQERLITTAEEPVDVTARAQPPALAPGVSDEDAPAQEGAELDAALKSEERLEPADTAPATAAAEEVAAVAPRRVRTMIVRPDGTLVPREEPAAAAPEQPAGAALDAAPVAAVPALAPANLPQVGNGQEAALIGEEEGGPVVETPTTVAVVPSRRVEPQAAAAAPAAQPAVQQPAAQQEPAATPVSAPAAAAPAASGATSEWSMQIASQPTAEGAQATYQDLARRYGSVLEGRGVNVVRANIEGMGTYYRVRIPASSRDEAIQLCTRYKAAGGSCFVSR